MRSSDYHAIDALEYRLRPSSGHGRLTEGNDAFCVMEKLGIHTATNSNDQKSKKTVICVAHKRLKGAATRCVLRPVGLDGSKCAWAPLGELQRKGGKGSGREGKERGRKGRRKRDEI